MRYIYFLMILKLGFEVTSQNPTLTWTTDLQSNKIYCCSIISDNTGNIYITGNFQDVVDFDPSSVTYTLQAFNHSVDAFVAKYSPQGDFLWARNFGGPSYDYGLSITFDSNGNIVFVGSFRESGDFDPGTGTYTLGAGTYGQQSYVCKITAGGALIWAKAFESVNPSSSVAINLVLNSNDDIFITGTFTGFVDFDPSISAYTVNSGSNNESMYVCELNSYGVFQWVKTMEGQGNTRSSRIVLDQAGNIYLSGSFSGVTDFDPSLSTFTLSSGGNSQLFICKLNPLGDLLSCKSSQGSGSCSSFIYLDNNSNIILAGSFIGTIDFDPGPSAFTLTAPTAMDSEDAFICKLDSNLNFLWAQQLGTPSSETISGIKTDLQGNLIVVGDISGTVDFDNGPGVYNLSAQSSRPFIYYATAAGNLISANIYNNLSYSSCMNIDSFGTLYLCSAYVINKFSFCASVINQENMICSGASATLVTTSSSAVNWYATATSTSPIGAGTSYITMPLSQGTYSFYAESNSCVNLFQREPVIISVGICAGENEPSFSPIPTLFPNPTNGSICIRNFSGIIEIYDNTGTNLFIKQITDNDNEVDFNSLKKGLYFLRTISAYKTTNHKILRQ